MQHEFSLSWRERRDAMVKRRLVKNVRLYSQKVEHYEVTQKCYRSIRIFFVTHQFNMGMNRDKHRGGRLLFEAAYADDQPMDGNAQITSQFDLIIPISASHRPKS